jgi:hypothetical protein
VPDSQRRRLDGFRGDDFLSADTNPVPAKWLAHRIGWMNATLRLPLVACAALLGH